MSKFRALQLLLNPNEALNNGQQSINLEQQQQRQQFPHHSAVGMQQHLHQQTLNPGNKLYYRKLTISQPLVRLR